MNYTPVFMRHFTLRTLFLIAVFTFAATPMIAQTTREYSIVPSLTDPAINDWNSPHLASSPGGTPRNVLLVHFVGTGGTPQASTIWYRYAAALGFHVVALTHSNDVTVASLCGNSADSACFEKVRREIIDGTDRTTLVTVNRAHSIENRLIKVLQYLQRTAPASENWGQFLTAQGSPAWSSMIFSGHSQGGGHAAMIGRLYAVQRVIQFASVADYSTRFSTPAFWISTPKATPSSSYFGLGHTQDESVPWARLQQNWNALGMAQFGGVVNVDNSQTPYSNTRQLYTGITPAVAGQFHGSMIVNPWMPLGADGLPTFKAAWEYLLAGQPTNQTPANQTPTGFQVSFDAGTRDANGNFMGGTELRVLAAHKGKLYGGTETWMDSTPFGADGYVGAQIFRLDAPTNGAATGITGAWQVDKHFNQFDNARRNREKRRNEGITALESIIFRTDSLGRPLAKPDTLLVAAARDFWGTLCVYSRNDANGVWVEDTLAASAGGAVTGNDDDGTIRSFSLFRDKVTGADRIFAGALPNGIFSGVYDASLPGKIRWNKRSPELTGFRGRPMAFAVCNGDLHIAIAPNIWRRRDGASPRWDSVFYYPLNVMPGASSGFRGLTAVPNPSGQGQSLLAALEGGNGQMVRLDPATPLYRGVQELDIMRSLSTAWGYKASYVVIANSEMTWIRDPKTGDSTLTITIQHHPAKDRDDAFYYIRRAKGTTISYELRQIDNTKLNPKIVLNSTRACSVSPFPQDSGKYVYIGGYDADNVPSLNTAYVLRTDVNTLFGYPATITSVRENAQNFDVQDITPTTTLTIFPNPASNLVSVQGVEGSYTLMLTNILGQTVMTLRNAQSPQTFDVSLLPAGVYFLQSEQNSVRKKSLLQIVR